MSRLVAWEDQRAFLAVLEEGSLSAAARRLGVTQPTMRARIEALEHGLGTVLFTRSANGLVPTDQARALGDSARAMARASEAFVRAASAPPGEVAGVVRISVSESVGIAVLPPMLASLRLRHSKLIVEVALSNASADLLEQEVDIAVRMHPPRHDALVAKKIGTIELGLFAHVDYLARRGIPVAAADLATHDFIGPDRARADLQLAATLDAYVSRDQFVLRTDSHPAQLEAARSGLGIAVVQRPIGLADPLLRAVLPSMTIASMDTWIVTHANLRRLPRVSTAFDHLVEAFARFARSPPRYAGP
jgi:DNA-binding transcriptional LysR family regulator